MLFCSVARNMFNSIISTAIEADAGGVDSKVLLFCGVNVMRPVHAARPGDLGGAVLWNRPNFWWSSVN